MKMAVEHLFVENANLMVRLFVFQPTEGFLLGDNTSKIKIYGVEDFVVCHTANYSIERVSCLLPCAAGRNIVEPLLIVVWKCFDIKVGSFLIQFIFVYKCLQTSSCEAFRISHRLTANACQVEASSKVKFVA